jgi:hypothetical protein
MHIGSCWNKTKIHISFFKRKSTSLLWKKKQKKDQLYYLSKLYFMIIFYDIFNMDNVQVTCISMGKMCETSTKRCSQYQVNVLNSWLVDRVLK